MHRDFIDKVAKRHNYRPMSDTGITFYDKGYGMGDPNNGHFVQRFDEKDILLTFRRGETTIVLFQFNEENDTRSGCSDEEWENTVAHNYRFGVKCDPTKEQEFFTFHTLECLEDVFE